jgi:hypothetical protein
MLTISKDFTVSETAGKQCAWKEFVDSGDFMQEEVEQSTMQALTDKAAEHGHDFDSLDMVEAQMTMIDSEAAQTALRNAAGACACDGSGCEVVTVFNTIVQDPNSY